MSVTNFFNLSPPSLSSHRRHHVSEDRILIGNKWLLRHYLQRALVSRLEPTLIRVTLRLVISDPMKSPFVSMGPTY